MLSNTGVHTSHASLQQPWVHRPNYFLNSPAPFIWTISVWWNEEEGRTKIKKIIMDTENFFIIPMHALSDVAIYNLEVIGNVLEAQVGITAYVEVPM